MKQYSPVHSNSSHELPPVPTAIFDEEGNLREAETTDSSKNALKAEA